jgi:hypothetical protein
MTAKFFAVSRNQQYGDPQCSIQWFWLRLENGFNPSLVLRTVKTQALQGVLLNLT